MCLPVPLTCGMRLVVASFPCNRAFRIVMIAMNRGLTFPLGSITCDIARSARFLLGE